MMGLSKTIRLYRAARARRKKWCADQAIAPVSCTRLIVRAIGDDAGGEVLEFALVAGLIIIACISIITCVGIKITNKWSTVNNSM
jgi:Flp pilus assembly pilin Flp